ncbi:HmuY protein [Chitinophaga costaii]|uniref:HmuY protein n=1 Tax=Chitinophaga costaii TaxID=1335309 RepID=A0A1C4EE12_9BACT|nr:HmuY family protein [Chitinophaga costaii]PUZ23887.1 hypothetical protein DCM91_13935 [Chitinophaga costaii]SCC41805.1 HmuY protein [Chitinophaga costaii]
MKKISILLLTLAALFSACTKDTKDTISEDGASTVITDLPGDTTARVGGNSAGFKILYFRFATGAKVTVADEDKASLQWDLAFTGPYNSEVYVNSGTYEYNPGYKGPGQGAIVIVNQDYDQVNTAPDNAAFNSSTVYKIGWDAGNGVGWFFYSLDNHIVVPVQHRTFVLRTPDGKYGKLELINVYKGNPPVVTDLFWPAPYFTFRYYVQPDGSRNIRTKQ